MPSITGPSASTQPLTQKQNLHSLERFLSPPQQLYKETHIPCGMCLKQGGPGSQ